MEKTINTPGKKRLHYKYREKLISQKDKEITRLLTENLSLKSKLENFINRNKSKARKDVIADEKVIKLFSELFEQSLEQRSINHYRLKELEKYINNPNDQKVLYFLMQQTINNGKEFTILTEKEIKEGKKIGYMVLTPGTGLSPKTVALCLNSLEIQGLIYRYRENKHKSVFLLNTLKGRQIYKKLENKEFEFAYIEHVLLVKGAKL